MPRAPFLPALTLLALAPACRESAPPPVPAAPPAAATPSARPAADVEWGVVEGRVRLEGAPPAPARAPTTGTVVSVCGEETTDRSLVVGAEGALAHAVVALESGAGLPAPATPPADPVLDQKKCLYDPPALAARAGATLTLRNSDPLVHNVRAAFGTNRTFFNVAMPLEGMATRRALPAEPGLVPIRCDIHPWMHAVVRTFDHPYFGTTSQEGRFRMEVPEGSHTLIFWHERLPETKQTVTVRAGETVQIEQVWKVESLR
ncbi:hypothetical protein LZ198_39080 [Myxococcus sp. K15C18031901]|uniref:hypothetical protein n=1 Tax=Myxococcus dinghuensis TaxID=2906761 RepID=UPI0020A7FB27|nr:hypothetical protein [Myxococcus dinghuensis]MCP3104887.1 hypothetical protein [Myxococcus dinghuensis]